MSPRPRPSQPRLPLATELEDKTAEWMAFVAGDDRPLNLYATLAHNGRVFRRFTQLGGTLLSNGTLAAREREIVILRVGWNCQSVYEFGQHTVIGRRAGLSPEEIARLARPGTGGWDEGDATLVLMADELCAGDCVSDGTWEALARRFHPGQLVELVVLAGYYRLVSGFLNSAGVELDPGVPDWPEGAVLPG
ncbi:MAG TPA: carboxymuconolactone decarboxylase family protein [Acidimicrobiales bacterium]|nr:carboxymuconolactone decarboxylase family protein [Acidimicrobiales bacterium]